MGAGAAKATSAQVAATLSSYQISAVSAGPGAPQKMVPGSDGPMVPSRPAKVKKPQGPPAGPSSRAPAAGPVAIAPGPVHIDLSSKAKKDKDGKKDKSKKDK